MKSAKLCQPHVQGFRNAVALHTKDYSPEIQGENPVDQTDVLAESAKRVSESCHPEVMEIVVPVQRHAPISLRMERLGSSVDW
jgi:hypothetical protein